MRFERQLSRNGRSTSVPSHPLSTATAAPLHPAAAPYTAAVGIGGAVGVVSAAPRKRRNPVPGRALAAAGVSLHPPRSSRSNLDAAAAAAAVASRAAAASSVLPPKYPALHDAAALTHHHHNHHHHRAAAPSPSLPRSEQNSPYPVRDGVPGGGSAPLDPSPSSAAARRAASSSARSRSVPTHPDALLQQQQQQQQQQAEATHLYRYPYTNASSVGVAYTSTPKGMAPLPSALAAAPQQPRQQRRSASTGGGGARRRTHSAAPPSPASAMSHQESAPRVYDHITYGSKRERPSRELAAAAAAAAPSPAPAPQPVPSAAQAHYAVSTAASRSPSAAVVREEGGGVVVQQVRHPAASPPTAERGANAAWQRLVRLAEGDFNEEELSMLYWDTLRKLLLFYSIDEPMDVARIEITWKTLQAGRGGVPEAAAVADLPPPVAVAAAPIVGRPLLASPMRSVEHPSPMPSPTSGPAYATAVYTSQRTPVCVFLLLFFASLLSLFSSPRRNSHSHVSLLLREPACGA